MRSDVIGYRCGRTKTRLPEPDTSYRETLSHPGLLVTKCAALVERVGATLQGRPARGGRLQRAPKPSLHRRGRQPVHHPQPSCAHLAGWQRTSPGCRAPDGMLGGKAINDRFNL